MLQSLMIINIVGTGKKIYVSPVCTHVALKGLPHQENMYCYRPCT